MHDQAQRVAEKACAQLADHMRDAIKYAPDYARRYALACLGGTQAGRVARGLHPDIAHLIRDAIQDELMFERRSGYSNDHRSAA